MLRDVVGNFLETLTEREFDGPLVAILSTRGFTDVHFIHGAFEFGKDVVAKKADPNTGVGQAVRDPVEGRGHRRARVARSQAST